MAGLTLQQLQQMGAKPKSQAVPQGNGLTLEQLQPQQSVKPTFTQKVGESIAKRRETFTQGLERQSRGQQTTPETALQATGQSVGLIYDVGMDALGSVYEKLPEVLKVPIEKVGQVALDTPVIKSGLKAISGGVDSYRAWKQGNPRAAANLESVVNIASLFPIGGVSKVAGKEALSIAGEQAGKVATKIETGLSKQAFNEALDVVKPVLTKAEKAGALERGRGVVQNRILPRRYERITLAPSQREKDMATVIQGIVKKDASPIDNITAIREEIGRLAGQVDEGLQFNNSIFNRNQIRSELNKAKEGSRIVFGSDKSLQSNYDAVIDEMMRQIDFQPKTLAGLNEARRNFDQVIKEKFPKLFESPIGDSARQNAVLDVRRAVNDYIEKQLPEDSKFRQLLREQSLMFEATKNIGEKTASAVDASAVQKVMRVLRQNPLTSFATGGILTYGAMVGMFSNPIVIGTLLLGGSVKLGQAVVTSKVLRQSLVSVLRGLEAAGKKAESRVIRDFLQQIPETTSKTPLGLGIEDVSKKAGGAIPKTTETLLSEARKYKSAEEFVNSKTNFYHVTNKEAVKGIEKSGFTPTGSGEFPMTRGVFLTEKGNKVVSDRFLKSGRFGDQQLGLNVEGKIFDASKEDVLTSLRKRGILDEKNHIFPKGTLGEGEATQLAQQTLYRALKNEGYVGVKLNPEETIIWDKNAIKTKSQLTSIWNEANMTDVADSLRKAKGLSADDIMKTYPDINLKRDVVAKDVYGNKVTIPEGEALTPYELKGKKVLLQDGETYIVSKNQYQNIKGNAISGEAKDFAPELKGTEESIKGSEVGKTFPAYNKLVEELMAKYDSSGRLNMSMIKDKLSPEDLARFNEAKKATQIDRQTSTKFSQYQLPGGKNYKEILIKAPNTMEVRRDAFSQRILGKKFDELSDVDKTFIINKMAKSAPDVMNFVKEFEFKSSHWDEPNVLAHLRLNERTYKGKKVTFMEELQSDWAREARAKGSMVTPESLGVVKDERGYYVPGLQGARQFAGNTPQEVVENYLQFNNLEQGIPNNPLLKNWQQLSVKRALKEAVDNGSEYLAWTTGEQQVARYNLATHLKSVEWNEFKGGTGETFKTIKFKPIEGAMDNFIVNIKTGIIESGGGATGKKLDEVLGKGLAEKILEKPTGNLSGEGLSFGGEWAKNLYDKQVKNIVEDLTGKKVEMIDLGLPVEKKLENSFVHINPINGTVKLNQNQLKVGLELLSNQNGNRYIITDILGDGKFKAVPSIKVPKPEVETLKKYGKTDYLNNLEAFKQTFDISTKKSAGQQAIKITPDIRALVKGESPILKQASGRPIR